MKDLKTLIRKLEARRNELEYSKEKMAREVGVAFPTYMSWTTPSGESQPSGENVLKIQNLLKNKERRKHE